MIIRHFSDVKWDKSRWRNFNAKDFACPHCGEMWWDESYFDGIQGVRSALGRPVYVNSAHRCAIKNAMVGGAPKSEHKKIALDFSLTRPMVSDDELPRLQQVMIDSGFRTFGLYRTFAHIDRRPGRFWVVKGGDKWAAYFKRVV